MAASLVFGRFRAKDVEELDRLTDPALLKRRLMTRVAWAGPNEAVVEELFFFALGFAREASFAPAKIGAFLAILLDVVEFDAARWAISHEDSFARFRELLLAHSVERPPTSTEVFSEEDAARILDYVLANYYRNFRMYKFALARRPDLFLEQRPVNGIDAPRVPRPLAEAVELL